jgi:hypothetical protein
MSSKSNQLRDVVDGAEEEIYRKGRHWKHYKGGVYCVDGIAIDTDNGLPRVLYHRVDGPDFNPFVEANIYFVRPLSEWFDTIEVDVDGTTHTLQRFIPVTPMQQTV